MGVNEIMTQILVDIHSYMSENGTNTLGLQKNVHIARMANYEMLICCPSIMSFYDDV